MKKLTLLWIIILVVLASVVFAEQAMTVLIRGDIIDNMCAGTQSPAELAQFVKSHTKECALAAPCVASGYSIFDGTKLYKFDKDSNPKIETFLRKENSKLQVIIEAKKISDFELSLVSIMDQK
jgi:hypothetical protein